MRVLSHDAFARQELVKVAALGNCSECGGLDGRGNVHFYYTRQDDQLGEPCPRYSNLSRFCSVGCFRIYNS